MAGRKSVTQRNSWHDMFVSFLLAAAAPVLLYIIVPPRGAFERTAFTRYLPTLRAGGKKARLYAPTNVGVCDIYELPHLPSAACTLPTAPYRHARRGGGAAARAARTPAPRRNFIPVGARGVPAPAHCAARVPPPHLTV